jgi:hypothetical protein
LVLRIITALVITMHDPVLREHISAWAILTPLRNETSSTQGRELEQHRDCSQRLWGNGAGTSERVRLGKAHTLVGDAVGTAVTRSWVRYDDHIGSSGFYELHGGECA